MNMKKRIIILCGLLIVFSIIGVCAKTPTKYNIPIDLPEVGNVPPYAVSDSVVSITNQTWTNETDGVIMNNTDVFEENKKYVYDVYYKILDSSYDIIGVEHFESSPYSLGGGSGSGGDEGTSEWSFYTGNKDDLNVKKGDLEISGKQPIIYNGKLQMPEITSNKSINYVFANWVDENDVYYPENFEIEYGKSYIYRLQISASYHFDNDFEVINNNKGSNDSENYRFVSDKITFNNDRTSATYEAVYQTIKPDKFTVKFINTKNNYVFTKEVKSGTTINATLDELNIQEFYTGYPIYYWSTKPVDSSNDGYDYLAYFPHDDIYVDKNLELYTKFSTEKGNIQLVLKCEESDKLCSGNSNYIHKDFDDLNETMILGNNVTKEGYKLIKWVTTQSVVNKKELYPYEKIKTEDIIKYPTYWYTIDYYPYWSNNYHTAKFHANYENSNEYTTDKEIYYDESRSIDIGNISMRREYYNLSSWNTKPDGTGTDYATNEIINVDNDIDLYAQWSPIKYKIRFNANSGSGLMVDQELEYNVESNINKNTFSKKGYKFLGWSTKPNGTVINYSDQESVINLSTIENDIVNLYAIYQFVGNVKIESNIKEIDYGKVDVNWNDNILRVITIKNTGNVKAKISLNNPTNDGPFGSLDFEHGIVLSPNQEYSITLIANHNGTYHDIEGTYNGVYIITATSTLDDETKQILEIPAKITINKLPMLISYTTHVQDIGWQKYVSNGQMAGTSGKSLRLEAIRIKLENQEYSGNIEYRTHIQYMGWENGFKKNNEVSGTSGKSLRLEAIEIKLTGEMAEHYDVYYRVHAQEFGWLGWAKNGEDAGSAGYSYRLEGIEIRLVSKDEEFAEYGKQDAFRGKIMYTTHVQDIGWQKYVMDGQRAGTTGKSLRLEAIRIKSNVSCYKGSVEYRTHIQNIGWESKFRKNDELSGTSGKSLRLEAIEIRLTEELEEHYDIYYRVHAQEFGWLNWAKNGEPSGTAGFGYRLEGIEIVMVNKGSPALVRTNTNNQKAFIQK